MVEGRSQMTWMCSADAHIDEPGDTWASRLPKALLDEASSSQAIGMLTSTASIMPVANDGIPASDDIPGRLRALDEDGIWAETIIGNRAGLVVLSVEDPDVAIACARAYNDYLVDTFGPHRDREIGVAFIPVRDIDDAVAEIKRAV